MLFSSFLYIFLFLPIVFAAYFTLAQRVNFSAAKLFLVAASFFFYGWWNPIYLPLLGFSILVNFAIGACLCSPVATPTPSLRGALPRKAVLILGITFNLAMLGYFKYANFFIDNTNVLLNTHIIIKEIILPLGISFFTFTQIAFLVDIFRGKAKRYSLLDYALFVSYFPHLLAGPIIHHAQMMPQFANKNNAKINYENIYFGLVLFIIGLAKKVVLADAFAVIANKGYADVQQLTCLTAWVTTVAYTLQIYFDFSGYTDMAIGASRLFNITLPANFNSPYQACNIREFWHRWHITLSNFLRDYLYIPLGGNRVTELNVYRNLILTFLLGGFWHGAGWTFIMWGLCHGMALSVHRWFGKLNINIPRLLAWFMTFNFINLTWIFFRANTMQQATQVLTTMFSLPQKSHMNPMVMVIFLITIYSVVKLPNSTNMIARPSVGSLRFISIISFLMLLSIIVMEMSNSHEFIYYNF